MSRSGSLNPRGTGPGLLVGALVGVTAAAVVVALLLVTGILERSSGDTDRELALPRTVGGLVVDFENETFAEASHDLLESSREVQERTAANWSSAYDGASTEVARYLGEDLADAMVVIAVAAESPGLAAPGFDLDLTGLELPPTELRTYGEVDCLVSNQTVVEGQEVPDDATRVVRCQRSGDGLTVLVESVTGDLATDPPTVARHVDDVYEALRDG